MANIDGANPFEMESTTYTMTPITFQYLNLPEEQRKQCKYMEFFAVIPGEKAPSSYQPFISV